MSAITNTVEIARRPEEVFAYLTDPSHFADWQENVVSVRQDEEAPQHVGSRTTVTRQMGRRQIAITSECDELDPPRTIRSHGVDGPIRPKFVGTVEPLDNGQRSRVTLSLDFETHGMGKVLTPLVVRPNVRKELPRNEQRLKELLEGNA